MSVKVMRVEDFPPLVTEEQRAKCGNPIEVEVRRRISLSVAAYAYEIAGTPTMTDSDFDIAAAKINRYQGTCHPLLDEFFLTEFSPMTGMWVHQHPELGGIERLYRRYYSVLGSHLQKINWNRLNGRQ